MQHDASSLHDPVSALAACLVDRRPLLAWAVEFACEGDPLPDAWAGCRDVLSMALIAAILKPGTYRDAMQRLTPTRLSPRAVDVLQMLALITDAGDTATFGEVQREVRRMFRCLPAEDRHAIENALRTAIERALPSLSLDAVLA